MIPIPLNDPEPDPDIHAFADNELGVADRSRLEASLVCEPERQSRLSSIIRVKDLVAALPRPAADRDLSAKVVQSIERAQNLRRRRNRMVVGLTTMAACAAACAMLVFSRLEPEPGHLAVAPVQMRPNLPGPAALPPSPNPLVVERSDANVEPVAVAVAPIAASTDAKLPDLSDREQLEKLLTMGEARQITIVVDDLNPATLNALDLTIQGANRRVPQHARISLVQNIVPGENGTVYYALVMDDAELDHLRQRIEKLHPRQPRDQSSPNPEFLTALGSVGEIQIRDGEPRGTLMQPPPEMVRHSAIKRPPSNVMTDVIVGPEGTSPTSNSKVVLAENAPEAESPSRSLHARQTDPPLGVFLVCIRERPVH